MSRWRRFVVSTAPRSVTDRQSRARSVPPDRFWISDASVELPDAVDDDAVELLVCGDERLRRLGRVHPREAALERGEIVVRRAASPPAGRDGLEDAPHLVELEQRVDPVSRSLTNPMPVRRSSGSRLVTYVPSPTRGSSTPIRVNARTASRSEFRDRPSRCASSCSFGSFESADELARHDQILDLRDRLVSQRDHGRLRGFG